MDRNTVRTPAEEPVIVITRSFEAPRSLVFKCYTEPRHMVHFWGPRGSTTVSEVDLRPGGLWRTAWRFPDGSGHAYSSVYLEIVPPERIVYRDAPDDWEGGLEGLPPTQLHSTIALTEEDGSRTKVTVTIRCPDIAVRDDLVRRGFAEMVKVGNDRLLEYLETIDPTAAEQAQE